jgi:hypothetical protein
MREILRTYAPKRALRASLHLILIAAVLAPYQAAQAISYWTAQGRQYFSFIIGGHQYDPVTDVYIYSESSAIDTKSKPEVSSRDPVGEWFYEFVKNGFDCRDIPEGGVRFFTNGKGIANGESATFSFATATDGEIKWLVDFFDTATGEWTVGAVPERIEAPPSPLSASEPPKSGRQFLFILLLLAFAYWFYNDRRKKRGPSDNGPDIK